MTLLQMSLSGAVMVFVIVVMRAVLINRLPKRTFVLLWETVLLRLILPFSIPSAFSVYSLMNRNIPVQNPAVEGGANPVIFQPGTEQFAVNTSGTQGWQNGLSTISWQTAVWLVGMLFCFAFVSASYLHWYREFRLSMPVSNEFVSEWLKKHPLRRSVRIRQSGKISAPLTYGILHPVIMMPKSTDWDNMEQMECVLLHEYMHICRYDTILKLIATFILCVHWFNPMVWLLYLLLNRDIELACDECVVRRLGEGAKAGYARTLILLEEQKSGLVLIGSHFSKNATEERIKAIMRSKKVTIWTLTISAVVLVAIVVLFATSPTVKNGQGNFALSGAGGAGGQGSFTMSNPGDGGVIMPDANDTGGQGSFIMRNPGDTDGQTGSDAANPAEEGAQMLFCMGRLFISTQEDVSEMVAYEASVSEYDSPYIGVIESSVDLSRTPEQELQSNFGYAGSEIVFNGSGIAVNMDGQWIQFLPEGEDFSVSTGFGNLVARLSVSISYANGSLSFIIPESGQDWHILINGRYEADGLGGMSTHFLEEMSEGSNWVSGETYSFPVEADLLTELYMVVSIGEESQVIDLMEYLPENASQPAVGLALNR